MKTELTRRARVLAKKGGPTGALARLSAVADRNGAVFDIGVNRGTIARHLIRIFPECPCYLFEPLPMQAAYVAERFSSFGNVTVVEEALSDAPGTSEFFVGRNLGTSSLLGMSEETLKQHPEADVESSIQVALNTVDGFCAANDITHLTCMKIDAQGSELNIFRGSERMLSEQRIDMIMFEWFATPHYENCPLILDLWNELDNHNYSMYNIFPGRSFANGQRRFGDAVFISEKFRQDRLPHL